MKLEDLLVPAPRLCGAKYDPPQWLIDRVLPHPSLGELFAKRGAGKTWAALSLAVAVAKGEAWLRPGFDAVVQRKVLYIDGEMPPDELAYRIKGLCGGEVPTTLSVACLGGEKSPPNYAIGAQWDKLWELTKARGIELVILDNWASLVKGIDENDNMATREVMDGPVMLRREHVSVLWVHHSGKSGTQRGASSREDPLDYVVALEAEDRPGRAAKFTVDLEKSRRRVIWEEPFIVELHREESGKLAWRQGEEALSKNARKALNALRASTEPMTEGAVRTATKMNGSRTAEALAELKGLGRAKRVVAGWYAT